MKIEIGSYVLCAGGEESPEDLLREAADTIQVVPRLRAAWAKVFNRGNRVHTLRFSITRSHASIKAAEEYLVTHPDAVPTTGDITITTEGAAPTTKTLKDGTCHAYAARQIGCSTTFTYTITGGEIT